ncbi:MAG: flavodoxin [Tissierellia bacterium]|nr:flavodoxin [Tissierellia bacterium]
MSKVAVVYWTGTGNTEAMANAVVEGINEAGGEAELIFSDDFNASMMDDFDAIAFGCPAMGDEVLEEASFEPMFEECEEKLEGRKIAIFGSYEWNNGEWMVDWEKRCKDAGANLAYDPLPAYDNPDDEALDKCRELGKALA